MTTTELKNMFVEMLKDLNAGYIYTGNYENDLENGTLQLCTIELFEQGISVTLDGSIVTYYHNDIEQAKINLNELFNNKAELTYDQAAGMVQYLFDNNRLGNSVEYNGYGFITIRKMTRVNGRIGFAYSVAVCEINDDNLFSTVLHTVEFTVVR